MSNARQRAEPPLRGGSTCCSDGCLPSFGCHASEAQSGGAGPRRGPQHRELRSIAGIVTALREISAAPAADVNSLLRAVGLSFLVGNRDATRRTRRPREDFALLSDPVVGARLSPLYDIVCTAVYDVTPRMAMFIGGTDDPAAITEDSCGGLRRTAESMSRCSFVTFERLPIVLASALPRLPPPPPPRAGID